MMDERNVRITAFPFVGARGQGNLADVVDGATVGGFRHVKIPGGGNIVLPLGVDFHQDVDVGTQLGQLAVDKGSAVAPHVAAQGRPHQMDLVHRGVSRHVPHQRLPHLLRQRRLLGGGQHLLVRLDEPQLRAVQQRRPGAVELVGAGLAGFSRRVVGKDHLAVGRRVKPSLRVRIHLARFAGVDGKIEVQRLALQLVQLVHVHGLAELGQVIRQARRRFGAAQPPVILRRALRVGAHDHAQARALVAFFDGFVFFHGKADVLENVADFGDVVLRHGDAQHFTRHIARIQQIVHFVGVQQLHHLFVTRGVRPVHIHRSEQAGDLAELVLVDEDFVIAVVEVVAVAAFLQGEALRVVLDLVLQARLGPNAHVVLVGVGQLAVLVILFPDDPEQFPGLLGESVGEILELAPAQLDAQIAVMDMDVFFHVEEEIAVARFAEDVAAIENFLDDAHG
ncbi:hypothetical protein [Methylogaea oryzae]|uniref:hypothetical protein n=1 Tax=Methylogaea oryzae TaxID=1295382 RepID=UPI0020D1E500|nr:hypothetical protein [Methylogaea oryzae]